MKNQINVVDDGDTVIIDVRDIHYSGLRGNVPDYTLTKHIGGENARTVSVTVSVTTNTVYEKPSFIDQLKANKEQDPIPGVLYEQPQQPAEDILDLIRSKNVLDSITRDGK
jgi:hypothetical protein